MSKYRPVNTGPDATIRDLMKGGTKDLHDVADTLVETTLLRKRMSPQTYGAYLSGLYALYSAMEEEMDRNQEHPSVAPLYFPEETHRKVAIEHDLEHFLGDTWRQQLRELSSIQRYVAHLRDIGTRRPELLIPHCYVRYFGDMSGGQILKRILCKLYKLPADGSGAEFYDFSHIAKISDFKNLYASRLNDIDLSPEAKEDLVQECRLAFQFNIDFLREVVQIAESTPGGYLLPEGGDVPELAQYEQPAPTPAPSAPSRGKWNFLSRLFTTSLFIIGSAVLVATITKKSDESLS